MDKAVGEVVAHKGTGEDIEVTIKDKLDHQFEEQLQRELAQQEERIHKQFEEKIIRMLNEHEEEKRALRAKFEEERVRHVIF